MVDASPKVPDHLEFEREQLWCVVPALSRARNSPRPPIFPAQAPKRKSTSKASGAASKKSKAATSASSKKASSPRGSKKKAGGTALAFATYADPDEGYVTFEGLGKLGEDLGIDASSDTKLLVLCWRLGAEKPGCVSEEEWAKLGSEPSLPTCDKPVTLETLKAGWSTLDPAFLENSDFRPFFKFCFEFNREGTKKFLERDTALALLPICIEDRSKHTKTFLEFLETKPEDFKINRDQWCSFLDFSLNVGPAPDFLGWDADESSWPILLDEFVEFAMDKAKA